MHGDGALGMALPHLGRFLRVRAVFNLPEPKNVQKFPQVEPGSQLLKLAPQTAGLGSDKQAELTLAHTSKTNLFPLLIKKMQFKVT